MRNLSPQRSPTQDANLREESKAAYQRGDFEEALRLYKTLLASTRDSKERQLLLSNIVACRLNIGGSAQAEAAVDNAKQCVALDDQWAKGYVRLAEAYIALGAGYSNDACNALQRAIQLDPRHPTARQMLIRELRRDHRAAASGQGGSHHERTSTESNVAPLETVDTAETDMAFGSNSREPSAPSSQTSRVYENVDDPSPQSPDSSSFFDNVQSQFTKGIRWYHSQSEDRRTMIHVLFLLLILYVAFGGRFGFEHQGHTAYRKGNYGTGNAYDQFYGRKSSSYEPSRHTNYHTSSSNNYYKQQYSSYEQPRRSSSSHDGRNYYSASFFDLSPILLILMGAAYLCHRNGIPVAELVSLFVWNFLLRGRRRYRRAGRGLGHHGMFRFRPRY